MKKYIFTFILLIIVLGLFLTSLGWLYGLMFTFLGFCGIAIYYLISLNYRYPYRELSKYQVFMEILTVLMSISLICRYYRFSSTDLVTLFFIPFYLVFGLMFLWSKIQMLDLKLVTSLYILLVIPMFFDLSYGPSNFLSNKKNQYSDVVRKYIDIPYEFKYSKTADLHSKAFDLMNDKRYGESIIIFKKAREIEPENTWLLFDQSQAFARAGQIETAIALMDTAIMLNNNYAIFHNNRGLLYYKQAKNNRAIENFKRGIELDSSLVSLRTNLALAYYYLKDYDSSCSEIEVAFRLGYQNDIETLKDLWENVCKQ